MILSALVALVPGRGKLQAISVYGRLHGMRGLCRTSDLLQGFPLTNSA